MTFTIASVNVNGIRAACKQRNENNPGMNVWLEETTADVVLMQEVRANPKETQKALAPALEAGWHLVQAESAAKGRAGVGILSRTPLSDVSVGFGSFSESGRFIAATVDAEGGPVRVASLYLPSGDTDSPKQDEKYLFLDEFSEVLADLAATYPQAVIGGDWNICHRAQDLKNNKSNEKKSGHLPEERAFMDHVFGSFPDELPQDKKGLGDYLGVIDYATKTDWSARVPGRTPCSGTTSPGALPPMLTVRTPGGPTAAKRLITTLAGASTTRLPPRQCWSARRKPGSKRHPRWNSAGRITRLCWCSTARRC